MSQEVQKITEDNNILKLLFIMAFPTIISGLVDSLYNTVDSIFVGRYVGSNGLAALSVINVIQLMYLAVGVLFSVGNASVVSRALGAKHVNRAKQSLINSFWCVFFISNFLSLLMLFNLDRFLITIGASEYTLPYAKAYGSIILWMGFILPINNLLLGSFRAKGKAINATYINTSGALLNIFLDYLFIVKFQWGVAGAAYATVVGQGIVLLFAVYHVSRLFQLSLFDKFFKKMSFARIKEIVAVGTPTGLRLILFVLIFSIANNILSKYGDYYISAFGVFNRFIMIMSMINISLSIGSQPLIGMNYGANLYQRVQKILVVSLSVGMCVSMLTSLFLLWAPRGIYELFTENHIIVEICRRISRSQGWTYCGWGLFIAVAEALQAMGRAKESFRLSIIYPSTVLVGYVVFDWLYGLDGTFYAFPVAYVVVGIAASISLYREWHTLNKKHRALRNTY